MKLDLPNMVPLYQHKTLGVNIISATWSRNSLNLEFTLYWVNKCKYSKGWWLIFKLKYNDWQLYSYYSKCVVFAGIWSSVFSLSLTQLWSTVTGVTPSWASKVGEEVNPTGKKKAGTMSKTTWANNPCAASPKFGCLSSQVP